ncbi:MAG TPA: DUF3379 family protein [Burkholderiales bacterium]|nr:DUF3379 family protein [Burkholderiales bacterium]
MDCLTLRRIKLATPEASRPEVVAHLRDCADCASFVQELEAFERKLQQVVAVPVPEGLADQIVLHHRESSAPNPAVRSWRFWPLRPTLALAASLVLGLSAIIGYQQIQVQSSRQALAASFVAHVLSEPEVLRAQEHVDPARLAQALASYGSTLSGPIGEIRHLGQCPIDGALAHHVFVQTAHGPATLILMPERRASLRDPLTREGFAVVILPLRGGSLGIVADSPDRAVKVEEPIRARIHWEV